MISVFGRKDVGTGILRNKTNGGEGVSGWMANDAQKAKLSKAHKGKTKSPETRRKMSEAHKSRWAKVVDRTVSPNTKEKMSKSQKGRKHSPETKLKMSESQKKRWRDG